MTTKQPGHESPSTMPANTYGAVELGTGADPHHQGGAKPTPTAAAGTSTAQTVDATAANRLQGPIIRDADEADLGQIVEISRQVPVLLDLWATWCQPCKQLTPILEDVVRSHGGRVVLCKIDVDRNPQIAQSLQAQSVPTVVAIIAGQPLPLFQGAQPRAQVEAIVNELLQVAHNNGLNAVMVESTPADESPVDPLHAPALAAETEENFEQAIELWQTVLAKQPRDQVAKEHLARCQLLLRLRAAQTGQEADQPGLSEETDPFTKADRLIAQGQSQRAFDTLLEAYQAAKSSQDQGESIRTRIVELFTVVGAADPAVKAARARLSSLVF